MSALGEVLAQAMAKEEGFGIPGAIPTRNHNPGDLRHAPGEMHPDGSPNSVGSFATDAEGWAALERQLQLYTVEHPGITVGDMITQYFAPAIENDTAAYVTYVCNAVGCTPDTQLTDALKL